MPELPTFNASSKPAATLVIGGGIGGMRAALDLASAGLKVYLIEQTSGLGGRVAQLGYMFPQHDCVLCRGTPDHGYGCTRPSISPAYIQHNRHPNIEILTNTRVIDVAGQAGDFSVSLRQEPRYVDQARCINCDYCTQVCPVDLPNDYQLGMTTRKAVYKVSSRATPDAYVIDRGPYCDTCGKCVEVCPPDAINLDEQPRLMSVEVGAIILALGFQTYDPTNLEELGYGRYANVLQAMQYERLASRSGPTEGVVTRPSDGKTPESIAWLQCIGSRERNNMFCSSICCMYATKEAMLAKERLGPDVECTIFIIDERAFNKEYSTYFAKAREVHKIRYIRCRVSNVREDPHTGDLILQYGTPDGVVMEERFDMVVLATGLQPPDTAGELAEILDIELNEHGFCQTDKFTPVQTSRPGVFVCGAFSSPKEIAETILDASGAAAEVMRLLSDRLNSYPYTLEWPFLSAEEFPPERDVTDELPRVGVYGCSCGGTISENIDMTHMLGHAAEWPEVEVAELIEFACFDESIDHLQRSIEQYDLNRVVIAACSNRTHDSLFQRAVRMAGLNPYYLELVNLREQCANVHQWQPEVANRKAIEMVRMGVTRVKAAQPVHKQFHRLAPVALVLGGGVAGMTAALAIADSGRDVHLVERTEMLGGNLLNLYYVAEGYNPQRLLRDLVNRVMAHQRINVYTRAEMVRHEGHVGFFQSTIRSQTNNGAAEEITINHGVTIVATGGREVHRHPWLDNPRVITQSELEERIIHKPEEIAALKDVVMVQCVGKEGVADYCSRVCCTNTMKNAIRLKLFNPECRVTVLYKDIVTYGFREIFYTEARKHGVIFIRYDDKLPEIKEANGKLHVRVRDLTLDREVTIPADLVPLAMSIAPAEGAGDLASLLHVPLSSEGFYEEAQLKLRPMDFTQEGIFLAGMASYPKFTEESITHALAAAARAITLLSLEGGMHLGGVIAYVDPELCVGCLTCTRTCPFAIPEVLEADGRCGVGGLGGAAFINPTLCQGCGTCTGECPASAIQLINYTDEQMMLRESGGLGSWEVTIPQPRHRN